MTWGIKHAAMDIIYKSAILSLLTYGAPVWIQAMNHECKTEVRKCTAPDQHKHGKGVPHHVKRGPLHVDGNDTNNYQT